MSNKIYSIRALSNMHVGSGDNNYGVIDNLVQRDVVTKLPTIHSSSLKGALREFMRAEFPDVEINDTGKFEISKAVKAIFGGERQKGGYNFFDASLISIPVRSNKRPFYRATCPSLLEEFKNKIEVFCSEETKNELISTLDKFIALNQKEKPFIFENAKGVVLESFKAEICDEIEKAEYVVLEKYVGKNIALFSNEDFNEIAGKDALPVIARNCLENGQSTNLWYEEIVPRESRFLTVILSDGKSDSNFAKITEKPVQIGANATIGYGFCDVKPL